MGAPKLLKQIWDENHKQNKTKFVKPYLNATGIL